MVDYLERSVSDSGKSYLVLHYTPSTITMKHSLEPLLFPPCMDPLLQRDMQDTNCLYTPNRLAKVVWSPVQNEAPGLFRFIQHFGFSYTEYVELLDTYNDISGGGEEVNYDEIACAWLNKERMVTTKDGMMINKTRYQQKVENLPLQGKPELYIGGIFPMTGNKYKAPELAKGKPI